MGLKLYKRGGNSTPSPTWKIESFDFQTRESLVLPSLRTRRNTTVSARKLGYRLWESMQSHSVAERMSHGGAGRRRRKGKDKGSKLGIQIDSPYNEAPRPSDSSFKREIAASVIQHHRSVERNSRALQTVSPASYNSSIEEVLSFNPPLSPQRFQDLKDKIENPHLKLKTPNDLVVILNRIWTLEEQNASNISIMNSMRRELDQSHMRIKVLLREKNKEQEKIKTKTKSIREELEDERNLRKQSESLHIKLARELSDTKASFTQTLKEYEREKNERILLEDLCDEFAKGIRDYEKEVRHLKHKPDRGRPRESPDRLILHLSEAWLDERMQMKHDDVRGTIVDKLSLEIDTFLRAKASKHTHNMVKSSSKRPIGRSLRRLSSESFHMNEDTSGPRNATKEEDDCTSNDSNCFQSRREEKAKHNTPRNKKVRSYNKQRENGVPGPRENSNRVIHKSTRNVPSLEQKKLREDNEVSKATSKCNGLVLKDGTLKSKLLEARLEGQHSRLKILGSST